MTKKFISFLIVFCILFSTLPQLVFGADNERKYSTEMFSVTSISVTDGKVLVEGESEYPISGVLIKAGYTYSQITAENISDIAVGLEVAYPTDGLFKISFCKPNVDLSGYTIYLSGGETNITVACKEYPRLKRIYVSPDGSDNNDGYSAPLKTIAKAKQLAQECSANDYAVDVIINSGEYDWENINFTSQDSGSESYPIRYIADGAEFRGTKKISGSAFSKVTDSKIIERLKPSAADRVLCVNLAENGITAEEVNFLSAYAPGGFVSPLGICVDGRRLSLARYPDEGYMYIDDVIELGGRRRWAENEGYGGKFIQNDENLKRWSLAENAYAVGFLGVEYWEEWSKIASVDADNNTVKLADWTQYGIAKNHKWYITNLIEELDTPGEYYIEDMTLYYYPDESFSESKTVEIATQTKPLICANGLKYTEFSGFKIFGAASSGIEIKNCENVTVKNCDISHVKNYGIHASGENLNISSNTVHNSYNTGIYLESGGDRNTLTPSGNDISDNHVYNTGMDSSSNWNGGISIGRNTVGTKVYNNLIHSIKNYSYSFGGNENDFSYNEVWSGNRETGDATPFYNGRDLSEYGNIARYNYIHHCYNIQNDNKYGSYGMGSGDDWASGITLENNIISLGGKANTAALNSHSRDNTMRYNILIDASQGVALVDRYKWIKNILDENNETAKSLIATLDKTTGLNKGYATTPIWLEKYPQISTIYQDCVDNNGRFMVRNNVITDNVSVNAPNNMDSQFIEWGMVERNYEINDKSIFVNADNHDYRIKDEAVAKYGLSNKIISESNFDMNSIGLKRNTAPVKMEFALTYPYNNESLKADKIVLAWDAADFADEYEVQISQTPDFSQLVYQKSTIYTRHTVDSLIGGKTYYWRVIAKNLSKQIGNEWLCSNSLSSFSLLDGDVSASAHYIRTGDALKVSVSVKNTTDTDYADAEIITAFYDESGTLKHALKECADILSGKEISKEYTLDKDFSFDSARVFVWDGSQKPIMQRAAVISERKYIENVPYEFSDFEIGNGWILNSDNTYISSAADSSATLNIQTKNAADYDFYYYLETTDGIGKAAEITINVTGGATGGSTYKTTIDFSNAKAGWIWFGKFPLLNPDGTGGCELTVRSLDANVPLKAIRAVEVN